MLVGATAFLIGSAALADSGSVAGAKVQVDTDVQAVVQDVNSIANHAIEGESLKPLLDEINQVEGKIRAIPGEAKNALPKKPTQGAENACKQVDGVDVAVDGTAAVCTSGGVEGNVAVGASSGGSTASATSGTADFDEDNTATAVAEDGSYANAGAVQGDNNYVFAGSYANGEASANSSSGGDRNLAIGLGTGNFDGAGRGGGPGGASARALIGNDNATVASSEGVNSTAVTNAGYGDRHTSVAISGANGNARADSAQGEDNEAFATAADRGHALAFNSYGDDLIAIALSKGDGSTGNCGPIGQPINSGQTTYPPDDCATANARSVDGQANTAISIVDDAKAYSVAERGTNNITVARANNGGDIIWNTVNIPSNPHAGLTPDCPWPLPPLPQAQQACGNATAKSSYGDGNIATVDHEGDHSFGWAESSGGSYNKSYATTSGANAEARARAIYNNAGTANSTATDGGIAETLAFRGYDNVALATANGAGSNANANASGPHAKATVAASSGGVASATDDTAGGPDSVSCSNASVTYALIGTGGQSCGTGF